MNIKNKQGFTLIELLSVIIILVVIAAITIPIIIKTIQDAKNGATINSAYGYIIAVEKETANKILNEESIGGPYILDDFQVALKGTLPTIGHMLIDDNGSVIVAELCIDDKKVNYSNNLATIDKTRFCSDIDVVGIIPEPNPDVCFIFNSGTKTITGYKSYINNPTPTYIDCTSEVSVPPTISGAVVTTIGNNAFKGYNLTAAYIPNGITTIGNNAFDLNSITVVIIGSNGLTIGDMAFGTNQFRTVYNIGGLGSYLFTDMVWFKQ